MKKLAEKLADKLSGDLSDDEMRAVMEDHARQVVQLEGMLASEKEKQMAALREKLKRRREEKEAALLRKQKEEVRVILWQKITIKRVMFNNFPCLHRPRSPKFIWMM